MTPHHKLYELLTRLGTVPEGLVPPCDKHPWWRRFPDGSVPVGKDHALAILRDAAMLVCDDEMVEISWDVIHIHKGEISRWRVEHRPCNEYELIAENCESYESALIAGLEWIAEQPK